VIPLRRRGRRDGTVSGYPLGARDASAGSINDKERLADGAVCTRLPAFRPLWSKGISLSFFVPIFRCVWRYAKIFSPFCCTSPKLFCHRKNQLTSCANP